MSRKSRNWRTIIIGCGVVMLFGLASLGVTTPAFAQDYIGSDACEQCHNEVYNDWYASGHPYKLMRSEEARNRPIPLPDGYNWDDITYVIGGFKWKSRYLGDDGFIITALPDGTLGHNQFNYATGEWVDYNAGAVKPYDCGRCHTTGWIADEDAETDNDLSDNQDGLPGIYGTFEVGGIHCEACHGPGAEGPDGDQPHGYIDASAEQCGTCHIRGEPNTIPASGGFIRHHEQYNEHLAGPHAALDCVGCHNPHQSSPWSITTTCEDCHSTVAATYADNVMAQVGVECTDCHMPMASKSAVALDTYQGDVMTHLFSINTTAGYDMFTEDGGFVKLDGDGKGQVNLDFACKNCHKNQTDDWLAAYATDFHAQGFAITPQISGTWGDLDRSGEGFFIEDSLNAFAASMYTYDAMGNQVWLLAVRSKNPAQVETPTNTSDTVVYIYDGASWGDDFDATDVNEVEWGTATFTFDSCGAGMVELFPNADMQAMGFTATTQQIARVATTGLNCPSGAE